MTAALHAPTIRAATPADLPAVRRTVQAAFGGDGPKVALLCEALAASGHVRSALVAEVAGAIVGHVMLNRSWLDARARLVEVLVLSPLSVAPDRQGAGIGTALVAAALDTARRLDSPAVFLEGDLGWYTRRGFVRASAHGFVRPSARVPDPAFQVAVLPAHEAWMTGALVYCEPFWALDCVGLRDPLLADVEARLGGDA